MGRRRMKNYNPMAIAESPMTAPDSRYRIVDESQSAHCCFGLTIVDTTKPDMVGGKQYVGRNGPQFKSVCECFEEADAKLICDALNLQALARGPQQAGGEDAVQAAARIASEAACLRIDNERLQAEVARLTGANDALADALREANKGYVHELNRAETAEAALREAGRDAERWRFLTSMDVGEYIGLVEYNNPDKLAHAIDAARLVRDGDSGEGES